LLIIGRMITAENIRKLIENDLSEKGFFVVDLRVTPSGKIMVFADSIGGITLDDCVAITRLIESKPGLDLEDHELEVSSPGLDNPLKLPVQYIKNTGRPIRIVKTDGETLEGKIKEADEEKFILETTLSLKKEKSKAEKPLQFLEIYYTTVKTAKIIIR
jgi:ribosome maturation factor RimP